MIRVLLLILAGGVGACAHNPWPSAYASLHDAPPVDHTDLLLVDFDEATRDRPEPGHEIIGWAGFTGPYSRSVESSLRAFASQHGATFTAWGARYMHTQTSTHLQPVFETYTSRRRGRYYDPATGRYIPEDHDRTFTATRYVPVVDQDAIYAFRAVFYRAVQP